MLLLLLRETPCVMVHPAMHRSGHNIGRRGPGARCAPNFILFNSRNRTAARSRPSADLVELSQAPPNRAVDVEARRFRARRFPGPWRHASGD
ncbi:hypothetical protein PUN28_002227 [Cardiocondyla obscurior]|uniref:Secreted protein n=1 Tax=Cardiocondyla obscurior TaxID=286306 RepID=A0AAW2GSP1_9HYME